MRLAFWLALLALVPNTAKAEWLQASSVHFVVYANDSQADIRKISDQLERYHAAMASIVSVQLDPPSPSNRVTVYIVSGEAEVRKLYGEGNKYVGGFYLPRAGGSLAIVPKVSDLNGDPDFAMVALRHEYAHPVSYTHLTLPTKRIV